MESFRVSVQLANVCQTCVFFKCKQNLEERWGRGEEMKRRGRGEGTSCNWEGQSGKPSSAWLWNPSCNSLTFPPRSAFTHFHSLSCSISMWKSRVRTSVARFSRGCQAATPWPLGGGYQMSGSSPRSLRPCQRPQECPAYCNRVKGGGGEGGKDGLIAPSEGVTLCFPARCAV